MKFSFKCDLKSMPSNFNKFDTVKIYFKYLSKNVFICIDYIVRIIIKPFAAIKIINLICGSYL